MEKKASLLATTKQQETYSSPKTSVHEVRTKRSILTGSGDADSAGGEVDPYVKE